MFPPRLPYKLPSRPSRDGVSVKPPKRLTQTSPRAETEENSNTMASFIPQQHTRKSEQRAGRRARPERLTRLSVKVAASGLLDGNLVGFCHRGHRPLAHWPHDLLVIPFSVLTQRSKCLPSHPPREIDNVYSVSILITNLSPPSDRHILESAIRNVTRNTKDRLTGVLHSPACFNQECPQTNWFEVQRLLTWTYAESTAPAQLMGTDVHCVPPHMPPAEGTVEGQEPVKEARVFEGDPQFRSKGLSYRPNASDRRLGWIYSGVWSPPILSTPPNPRPGIPHAPLAPHHVDTVNPSLPIVPLEWTPDHLRAGHEIPLSMGAWIARKEVIVGVTDWYSMSARGETNEP